MGGSYYADDSGTTRTVNSARAGQTYSAQSAAVFKRKGADATVLPVNRLKEGQDAGLATASPTPIVVALDVTASRGDDAKILYDKLPMFYGSIMTQGYAEDPEISFAAIGDAPCADESPIQVTDFSKGAAMDGWISKLLLEEGGGGTGEESYELTALYYARYSQLTRPGTRGVFFISGDESFYPTLRKADVDKYVGQGVLSEDLGVAQIFHELQRKYDVYVLYPQKPIEERRKAIDEELAKRLDREGAKSGDVTISLMWNSKADLDLHVTTPGGFIIAYNAKRSPCGGELDVDMNAGRNKTTKPVENVYWGGKGAPLGKYKVGVHYFSCSGASKPVPFKVAVTVNGQTEMIEGVCQKTKDMVIAKEFTYAGKSSEEQAKHDQERYGAYSDENILSAWASVVPKHRVLTLKTPKSIVDVMLGVLAVSKAGLTDSAYLKDLQARGQTEQRQVEVLDILQKWIKGEEKYKLTGGLPQLPPAGTALFRQATSEEKAPDQEQQLVDEMAKMRAQLEALQAENDRLKANGGQ